MCTFKFVDYLFRHYMSVCLTFESLRDYPGSEFRVVISKLEKKIQTRACVFTFSAKVEKLSSDVADLPRTGNKCTETKRHVKGVQSFWFCSLNMHNLWRCLCRRVVDLKLPILGSATL